MELSEMEIELEENVYITMRDGIKIAVDIYRPKANGRYPGILSMSPYLKELQQQPPELTQSIEAGATPLIVPRGYVHVIAQIRGSGLSQGQFDLFDTKQQQDGYDLVEWIAQQPWCNGNVGMLGESYFAMIQYLVAAQQPPHLKCITLFGAGADIYRDFVCQGGVFFGRFLASWGANTIEQCLYPRQVNGKLPPADLFVDWFSHPEDGPYYWERSAWTKYDRIKVPMLSICGVLPHPHTGTMHLRGQPDLYTRIKAPKRLIVVPWNGNTIFLHSKPLNEQIIRWFDYWLKDINTGIMEEPEVTVYDRGIKEWRYENEYPLARTKWTKFYLRSDAESATEPPYGIISREPATSEKPDRYYFPNSRKKTQAGKPVLAYATPPLSEDLRVWGPLSVVLYGSITGRDSVWFVRLGDVTKDGQCNLLSQGHLRASFREVDESKSRPGQPFHPFQNPVLPEPRTIYQYQIEMIPIFYTFRVGHKIWVEITSEDPSYHGGLHTKLIYEMLPVPAENTIYHDSDHPSHILLPVIPDAPITKQVGLPVSEIKWPL